MIAAFSYYMLMNYNQLHLLISYFFFIIYVGIRLIYYFDERYYYWRFII